MAFPSALAAAESKISDTAELMTSSVRKDLNAQLSEMENTYNQSFFIVTLADLGEAGTIEQYAEAHYTNGNYLMNGVALYVCMGTRDVYIYTAGMGSYAVNAYGEDYIYDSIIPFLSGNEFDKGFENYTDLLDDFMYQYKNDIAYSESYPYKEPLVNPVNILIVLGAAALISLSIVFVMKSQLKSVRPQTMALNYAKDFKLTRQSDVFLYSRTTRTAKPKANSSGGRSGGGFGGGSSGGGARKF